MFEPRACGSSRRQIGDWRSLHAIVTDTEVMRHISRGAPLEETDEIEIGWWLARRHWGRGIATEAARAGNAHTLPPLSCGAKF
jgi:RimJ/RimL family protein N-acetyltransferase